MGVWVWVWVWVSGWVGVGVGVAASDSCRLRWGSHWLVGVVWVLQLGWTVCCSNTVLCATASCAECYSKLCLVLQQAGLVHAAYLC